MSARLPWAASDWAGPSAEAWRSASSAPVGSRLPGVRSPGSGYLTRLGPRRMGVGAARQRLLGASGGEPLRAGAIHSGFSVHNTAVDIDRPGAVVLGRFQPETPLLEMRGHAASALVNEPYAGSPNRAADPFDRQRTPTLPSIQTIRLSIGTFVS